MKIIQYNNGPKGAQNLSKQQNVGIQMPANNSYQQSLYIAAISQFIGCEGLASPATHLYDSVEYTFDFYHPECGKVFKIFKSDDLSEYDKYVQYPGEVVVIIDISGTGCPIGGCACCDSAFFVLPRELGEKLSDTDITYVYAKGVLCEYIGDERDGTSQWVILDPIVLRELGEDEFDEDQD